MNKLEHKSSSQISRIVNDFIELNQKEVEKFIKNIFDHPKTSLSDKRKLYKKFPVEVSRYYKKPYYFYHGLIQDGRHLYMLAVIFVFSMGFGTYIESTPNLTKYTSLFTYSSISICIMILVYHFLLTRKNILVVEKILK